MNTFHKFTLRTLAVICLCCVLMSCAFAQEISANSTYNFSGTEFGEDASAFGIYVEQTPDEECCGLYLGNRLIRAGDFLPAQTLEQLVLRPNKDEDATACIHYRPIIDGTVGEEYTFTMNILSTRDDPPTAENGSLQTYRNIANSGKLYASDPEGLALTFRIETYPKRGSLELNQDGSFVYTPKKNKVGDDSFTFTASDPAGNVSETKTIHIEILKPADAATFSDLDETNQFTGMWMRSTGLYGGENLADQLCFCPDKDVTRGEFLVMAMKLADIQPEIGLLTSGFVDQETAPKWMQSYLVSAMRRGIVCGTNTEDGLCFFPNRPITTAEAACIVCNICHLQKVQSVSNEASDVPVWAVAAMQTADSAGIVLPAESQAPLSRIQAANLLYSITELIQQ